MSRFQEGITIAAILYIIFLILLYRIKRKTPEQRKFDALRREAWLLKHPLIFLLLKILKTLMFIGAIAHVFMQSKNLKNELSKLYDSQQQIKQNHNMENSDVNF